jgi:hypothetical protein
MEERRDEDAGTAARAAHVAWRVVQAGVLLVAFIVALDILGVVDVFNGDEREPSSSSRLPGEYLYLDDERVDAYLSQLQGGLSRSERRSTTSTEEQQAQLGSGPVVQVGGKTGQQEVSERTLFTQAADRFFELEGELESRFTHAQDVDLRFMEMEAAENACGEIKRLVNIKEGQILRITGANLRVPTYALALAKVAHADQFRPPSQPPVPSKELARLALESQPGLRRFVKRLGPDPGLPFRLKIMRRPRCEVFMPARYSKVRDAPSLLTGPVTIVGKVVRRLTMKEKHYFDVDTAVRWERALEQSGRGVRRTLGIDGVGVRRVVNASAAIDWPGLVLLPLAIYK